MKKITTPKYTFQCEKCNSVYTTEEAALQCERRHDCEHDKYTSDYWVSAEEGEDYKDSEVTIVRFCNKCKGLVKRVRIDNIGSDNLKEIYDFIEKGRAIAAIFKEGKKK